MPSLATPALDPDAAALFRRAGRIACSARDLGASMIAPGVKLRTVMETVEAFIQDHGARPGFPAQTSRNDIAAHYCPGPSDETVYEEGDVAKIDVGVEVDGYLADTARTVHCGQEPDRLRLIQASAEALQAAIAAVRPGAKVTEVSTEIERTIQSFGFRPVYNLTGHGLDRWKVHTAPQIPASPDRYDDHVLQPGMVIAIEPFATTGKGSVHERGRAEVFMMHREPRKMKGIDARAWEVIAGMRGLPFARRTFPETVPTDAVEATLGRLLRTGCLIAFPPLVDPDPTTRIAQTEHTMVVTEEGAELMTATPLDD